MSFLTSAPGQALSQIDLFLDSLVSAPVKDERATMEFPFFCLTKKPRASPLTYDDGKVRITIKPGAAGMATIWDKDILIYCASIINDRLERGAPVERRIVVPAYDILRVCQRGTGKRSYELLFAALERLRATTILTNITAADVRERGGFGWIDNFRIVEREDQRGTRIMAAVEIWLNEWTFRSIVTERRVLTIDRAYFRLKMGLERRLYELARKHCGRQPQWQIGMPRLHAKCGAEGPLRNFKVDLKTIIGRDSLPGYRMHLMYDGASSLVKGMRADGYQVPARYRGNEGVTVVFRPRPNERAGGSQSPPVDM